MSSTVTGVGPAAAHERCVRIGADERAPHPDGSRAAGASPARPSRHRLTLAYALSLVAVALAVGTAVAGLAGPAGRYGEDPEHPLAVEVPAVLVGGVLLWRRRALGYVVGAGLLLQFGATPAGLAAVLVLRPFPAGSPVDVPTVVGLLVFSAVCAAGLACFVRGAVHTRGAQTPPG